MREVRRRDRGATLVEYALIVALVVVVLISAVTTITDSGDDKLAASGDRAGTQPDNAYYAGGATTSTTTASSTTSTTALPGQAVQPSNLTKSPAPTSTGSKWIANTTVTVTTTAPPNTGIAGLLVEGVWSLPAGGPDEDASCTTTSAGTCTLQYTDINDAKNEAVFTITSISGPGFFWTPGPGDVTTITIGCSPPLDSGCD